MKEDHPAPEPTAQDLAALLHIGDRQCALILKHMVEAGRLVRTGQRYALPVEEKAIL